MGKILFDDDEEVPEADYEGVNFVDKVSCKEIIRYNEGAGKKVVFWAVRAVMALMANTPFAVMVLMSAWIPAPPLESLPAMVNAVLISKTPFQITARFSNAAQGGAPNAPRVLRQRPVIRCFSNSGVSPVSGR